MVKAALRAAMSPLVRGRFAALGPPEPLAAGVAHAPPDGPEAAEAGGATAAVALTDEGRVMSNSRTTYLSLQPRLIISRSMRSSTPTR